MRARAFNPQIFLESLCYCVFGGILLHLVHSGKYLSYVTPRMAPYLYFTIMVMGIWTLVGLARVFRPQHRIRASHCFVLAIPILLLLLPHSPLSASDFSGNYIGGNMFSSQTGQYGAQKKTPSGNSNFNASSSAPAESSSEDIQNLAPAEPSSADVDNDPTSIDSADSIDSTVPDAQSDTQGEAFSMAAPYEGYSANLPGLDEAKKKITVSNDDFGMWFFEICVNMEKYEGYTIVMTGAVYKDPQYMEEDEFVPSRMMMSCCAADLATAGLLCKYDNASNLQNDSWVTVEGTLFIREYEYYGQKYYDPQIRVTNITPAEAVEGYIYPY